MEDCGVRPKRDAVSNLPTGQQVLHVHACACEGLWPAPVAWKVQLGMWIELNALDWLGRAAGSLALREKKKPAAIHPTHPSATPFSAR